MHGSGWAAWGSDGKLVSHPSKTELEKQLGIGDDARDRLDAQQAAEAERQAKTRAKATQRLPRLRDRLTEAEGGVRTAVADLRAAFRRLGGRVGRVRCAVGRGDPSQHRHGPSAHSRTRGQAREQQRRTVHPQTHRWHTMSEALDALADQAVQATRNGEG